MNSFNSVGFQHCNCLICSICADVSLLYNIKGTFFPSGGMDQGSEICSSCLKFVTRNMSSMSLAER